MMKIIVDAFGGDNAPQEIVRGAIDALREENGFSVGNCIECCSEELKQILGLPYKRQYNAINKLVASGVVYVEHKNGPTSARFIAINYDKAEKYLV